jgi:hypothetical protein
MKRVEWKVEMKAVQRADATVYLKVESSEY